MKILHVNYSDSVGGAAIAVNRLHRNLLKMNIESNILVKKKETIDNEIFCDQSKIDKNFDRVKISLLRRLNNFLTFSTNSGSTSFCLFKTNLLNAINNSNSDLIHLHWIGNETISISQIKKINKPIVWTFWDMWPINGSEHYSDNLRNINGYQANNRGINEKGFDLNRFIWNHKLKHLNFKMNIICPSKWLYEKANKSRIFIKSSKNYIPLSVDKSFWLKENELDAKKEFNIPLNKKILLFSSTSGTNNRKGFNYLVESLNLIDRKDLFLLVVGEKPKKFNEIKMDKRYLGIFEDREIIRKIYSTADLIVMPSVLEVFGQVILEGASCSVPSVIFNNTGSCDLVKHKVNGYVAEKKSIDDFIAGINWCLESNEKTKNLGKNSRKIVENNFDDKLNIEKTIKLYKNILEEKN
jgi:glycosyltransferase involved in cell wall biosynthesis